MKKKTKADRIRRLHAAGRSVREIARRVGCLEEYVRICARQRAGGGLSEAERTYRAKPGVRERIRERARKLYAENPEKWAAVARVWRGKNRVHLREYARSYRARKAVQQAEA